MEEIILTLNIGSASVKFSLFSVFTLKSYFFGQVEILPSKLTISVKNAHKKIVYQETYIENNYKNQQSLALKLIFDWVRQPGHLFIIKAVGHRVVHGGEKFTSSIKINSNIIKELEKLVPLAPLHQPYNIAGMRYVLENAPSILQVACFDTAFHSEQADVTRSYALPEHITPMKIQSYGFHGLSYEYIIQTLPERNSSEKNIIAHLGNGASLCATFNKKSVATTMGFTALDGLPMGSRSGHLDPGVILYLLSTGMCLADITELLYHRSGLLGISGISSDMRVLLNSADPAAQKAVEVFVYRTVREIGSLTAALNGLDNIIFTAGIGEHMPQIRQQICEKLSWLKINISLEDNLKNIRLISSKTSGVKVWVIPTNEELMIAKETLKLLQEG